MQDLHPPVVYVHRRVYEDRRAVARMQRMMTRIRCNRIEEVDDARVAELIRRHGWLESRRKTGRTKNPDPPILFNAFDWPAIEAGGKTQVGGLFFGLSPWTRRDGPAQLQRNNIVCQTAWELHSVRGCLFKCQYCYFENVLCIMLDLERFAERLAVFMDAHPEQTLYKYDNNSDILAFEPEYAASDVLLPLFARRQREYLMHYTKSDNVDHLLELDHRGKTIVCWTLGSETVAREIEVGTASATQRIAAMRKCQEAGFPVRCRLSPIFPVRRWREEYAELIRHLLSQVRPDIISLLTLSRLPEFEMIERLFDLELFDPDMLAAAERARDEMRGRLYGPLPHAARAEIYRFVIGEIQAVAPDQPVSICLESPEMWQELADVLRMPPRQYGCCCGPVCTPGHPYLRPARLREEVSVLDA